MSDEFEFDQHGKIVGIPTEGRIMVISIPGGYDYVCFEARLARPVDPVLFRAGLADKVWTAVEGSLIEAVQKITGYMKEDIHSAPPPYA